MTGKQMRNSLLLVLTALIWGIAFVAQSEGGAAVGPFSFNSIRSVIGGVVLLPVIVLLDKMGLTKRKPKTKEEKKLLLKAGLLSGLFLSFASSVQQLGIYLGTTPGKAGFLTACYILFVPLLGIFLHRKCGWNIWVGVGLALIGLYFLCINGDFYLQTGDILVLCCAVLFAFQIMVVDYFAPKVDGVRMACIQFFVSGIVCAVPMVITEWLPLLQKEGNLITWGLPFTTFDAWIPILYAGVLSCGVAYTLQIIGQVGLNPTVASLLMSLESVFSVLAGWVILHQKLSPKELLGCGIIFVAIILAQLPVFQKETS